MLSISDQTKLEIEQHFYKSSLYNTAKYLCGYKDIDWDTHGQIIRALEESSDRKMIVCPRGGFKTSLCVIANCVWKIINNPNIRILIDSELFTNSKNHIREIQSHLESERFRSIFGAYKTRDDWSSSRMTIAGRTKILKEPTICAGGLGTRKIGQHFDLWILDDMNSPQNSDTKEKAQKVTDHYKYGLSILEPDGIINLIGTRYSELDLIQHVLDTEINPMEGQSNEF